jgi:hypothetical protein
MEASAAAQRYRLQAHQFRATAKRTRTGGILRDLEALPRLYAQRPTMSRRRPPGTFAAAERSRRAMPSHMPRLWTEQGDRDGQPALSETARVRHYRALGEQFMEMSKTARTDIGASDLRALARQYEELAAYVEAMEMKSGAGTSRRSS